ncbi:response regulator transcription factor [Sphaerisporangium sp. TRM90804]|uniref:response regulator transcription factor n=1 Tax=Sphaerisporangium sp. TRM90804 TaxID=3031113 RepID=UPI00244CD482|nr:response regulator transcription factor [Sphaerisporangium sp. TRM90804]MDH2426519.1 response regulator transcription factor [Sphaerisporangium sp. TRM90804]
MNPAPPPNTDAAPNNDPTANTDAGVETDATLNNDVTSQDPPPPIRVLLAEDEVLLRDSLKVLIDATPGLTTVGEAGTGAEAVLLARRQRPDVVLMDVRMPDMDGIEATRRICADPATTGTRILILTTFDQDEYVYASLKAGASGFLIKSATATELLAAIRVVASGEALLAPTVTRRLITHFLQRPHPAPAQRPLDNITPREQEVLTLIARGMSNTEIAAHLHLTVGTVKTHISRLLSKLQARDRAQLVIAAYAGAPFTPPDAGSHRPGPDG